MKKLRIHHLANELYKEEQEIIHDSNLNAEFYM